MIPVTRRLHLSVLVGRDGVGGAGAGNGGVVKSYSSESQRQVD